MVRFLVRSDQHLSPSVQQLTNHVTGHMSSIYENNANDFGPGKVLDGDTGSKAVTLQEAAPWIAVEYPGPTEVSKVEIINAPGGDGQRTKDCEVRLVDDLTGIQGSAMFTGGTLLGSWAGPGAGGETFTINPPGRGFFATGKFVLFQCATAGDHLNVMEIKVFAGDTMRCVSHFTSEHDF